MNRFGWTAEDIYLIAERGHALHLQGRHREAAVIFEGLVAADPDNAYCREALAVVRLALDEPEAAVEVLTRLLDRDPGHLAGRARRCEANLRLGDTGAALRDFEFLRRILPEIEVRRLELQLEAATGRATYSADQR